MEDLISRKAVLDIITENINQYWENYSADQINMWGLFRQIIMGQPAAGEVK